MAKIFQNASGVERGGKPLLKSRVITWRVSQVRKMLKPQPHTLEQPQPGPAARAEAASRHAVRAAPPLQPCVPGTGPHLLDLRSTFSGCSVSPGCTLLRFTAHIPARSSWPHWTGNAEPTAPSHRVAPLQGGWKAQTLHLLLLTKAERFCQPCWHTQGPAEFYYRHCLLLHPVPSSREKGGKC